MKSSTIVVQREVIAGGGGLEPPPPGLDGFGDAGGLWPDAAVTLLPVTSPIPVVKR